MMKKTWRKMHNHEKEMLPEKKKSFILHLLHETFEISGFLNSFGDDGFDLFSSIENLI